MRIATHEDFASDSVVELPSPDPESVSDEGAKAGLRPKVSASVLENVEVRFAAKCAKMRKVWFAPTIGFDLCFQAEKARKVSDFRTSG